MIYIKYRGRLGNKMFQYALGRYLAEEMHYQLKANPLPFIRTNDKISGESYEGSVKLIKNQFCDITKILANPPKSTIVLDGWFQQSQYYLPFMDRIREWFGIHTDIPNELIGVDESDLLISVRLGDYYSPLRMTLTMQFYETAIEMAAPRKIFITTDEPNHPFINQFKKYKPIILTWLKREKEKAVLDLFSAMHFKKIAMSCSTFSWWSALLSDASKIYFPIDEDGMWSKCHINPDSLRQNIRTSIDLRVDDPRIIYFYNCPTIKTNRISPGLLSLSAAAPNLMPFHRNSIAFWYR